MKLSRCLHDLGIADASIFEECNDVNDEFKVIRKIYLKKALQEHPDKGGNTETFRTIQASWEVLRDLFDRNKVQKGSFTSYLGAKSSAAAAAAARRQTNDTDEYDDDDDDDDEDYDDDLYQKYSKDASSSYQSYQYYEDAEKEEVPIYKVEPARSDRSKCQKCKTNIPKMGIRIGSIDKDAGSYGRWIHLDCWRVPMKIQHGLTNPKDELTSLHDLLAMEEVLLTGVRALDSAAQLIFVRRCVNPEHWAGSTKRKAALMSGEEENGTTSSNQGASKSTKASSAKPTTAAAAAPDPSVSATTSFATSSASTIPTSSTSTTASNFSGSNTVAPSNFSVAIPGVNGALDSTFLRGKTFVITGTFPEANGSGDDGAGIANVTAMIRSFGGKVITRFSKLASFLLVGKMSSRIKFSDAASRSVRVVNLQRLHSLLIGSLSWEQLGSMPALSMENFGADYQYGSTPFTVPVPIATTLPSVPQPCTAAPAAEGTATMPSKPNPPATKAKATKSKPKAKKAVSTTTVNNAAAASSEATTSTSLVPSNQTTNASTAVVSHTSKNGKFIIPRPGVNGAVAGVLNNKTFVLTGVFPEVGGGIGLALGKDRTKAMIESFGGRVTSSVSGKTNFLVVGQQPGASKVSKAEERNLPLIDLLSLQRLLMGQQTIEAAASAPPPRITNFSAGYAGQKRISYY